MNPNEYFAIVVEPTVAEFLGDTTSLRRGLLASMTLYHMLDSAALACGAVGNNRREMELRREQLRKELATACSDFSLIGDIANTAKHLRLGHTRERPRAVSDARQIVRAAGLFEAPFGFGGFAEGAEVMVKLNDGGVRPLHEIIRSVNALWTAWLAKAPDMPRSSQ